jgi:hypothetical protein
MGYYLHLRIFVLVLLISSASSVAQSYGVYAQQAQTDYREGGLEPSSIYRTSYANLSISAVIASTVSGTGVVGVAGQSPSGGYLFEAIHIDRSLKIFERSIYTIGGKPTAISSDGDYGSYIAVGDEKGEVLVYRIPDRKVSYIQASRYSIKSVTIGVGGTGDPYLAVLDSGGYLYMYRATRGGWAEIGPKRSTALYNYTGGRVLDISPAEIVSRGSVSVDPSLILMIYAPPSVGIRFRVLNESGYPIVNATISANLIRPEPSRQIMFQALTGGDGLASLDLPILDPYNNTYNIKITHPDYLSETLILGIRYLGERVVISITYRGGTSTMEYEGVSEIPITMKGGQGELVPLIPPLNVTLASIVDLSKAPEEIRIGKPIPIFINPVVVKLIKPSVSGVAWSYIGVVIGCCIEESPASIFIYYDQSLNILRTGGAEYRWYILPENFERGWIGYDNNGYGVTVALSNGKVYYFLYDIVRGYHVAYWGTNIAEKIHIAFYRNSALVAVGGNGSLYIQRLSPPASMPCTRSGDYLGIPLEPGVGASLSPDGAGYIVTVNSIYILWGLAEIVADRCPLDMVRVRALIDIEDVISRYVKPVSEGYVEIYEGGDLVARSGIYNGSSTIYLPPGVYDAVILGGFISYRTRISVPHSILDLKSPTLYRVNISIYYQNPESPYTASLQRAPPGVTLIIDNRTEIVLGDNHVEMLLPGGVHSAFLTWRGIVLARGYFNVSYSGNIDLVLIADLAALNVSITVIGGSSMFIPMEGMRIRVFGEGPLLRGDLGFIRLGEVLKMPLGIYRIFVESPFFYPSESIIGLREAGSLLNISIPLRPREIPVRLIVMDDFGSPISNAMVLISRIESGYQVFRGSTFSDGSVLIPSILIGDYLVSVEPVNMSMYNPYQAILRIDRQEIIIRLNRTHQPVSIALIDPLSIRPIAPLKVSIYVENRLVYSVDINTTSNVINASIPFGRARIVVEPSQQAQQIYATVETTANIDIGGGRVEIRLLRKIHEIELKIINDISQPVQGAIAILRSAENPSIEITGISDNSGSIPMRLPYSIYTVEINAQGYNKLESTLTPGSDSTTYRLQPTILSLFQRYTLVFIASGMVLAIIFVARYMRRYIERKAREEAI